ncbi:MAG: GDYXXLXY domain-containing protein [Burkholderiales bacterium]
MRKWVVIVSTLVLLVAVNLGIASRERLVEHGRIVLLELAPVDPRSLMQGDYMALRFGVTDGVQAGREAVQWADGRMVLGVDSRNVGTFRRLDAGAPPADDELLLRYRIRDGLPKLATNAYFFEEGTGDRYVEARYGEFRVAPDGEAILTGLRDGALAPLGPRSLQAPRFP